MNRLIHLLFFISFSLLSFSQDALLNLNSTNKTFFNPALANYNGTTIGINYLYQYKRNGKAYNTGMLMFDRDFNHMKGMNMAGLILYDEYGKGERKITSGQMVFAYEFFKQNRVRLSTGLQCGVSNSKYNFTIFSDRYVQTNTTLFPETVAINNNYFDLSTGVAVFTRHFFTGISLYHFNMPDEKNAGNGRSKLPMKFSWQTGFDFYIRKTRLKPVFIYSHQGKHFFDEINEEYLIDPLNDLTFSMDLFIDFIYFGIGYHYLTNNPDAYFVRVGIKKGKVEVSYEYGMSLYADKENTLINNFHNISLGISFPKKIYNLSGLL